MADDPGHNYSWSPPPGGWPTLDADGKVVRPPECDLCGKRDLCEKCQ